MSKSLPELFPAAFVPPEVIEELRTRYHLERCRLRPWDHQVWGIHQLITKPYFALFDEMGAGKSLQAIVAAQVMFLMGMINHVIVLMPKGVKDVWWDTELGELAAHLWEGLPSQISWIKDGKYISWMWGDAPPNRRLYWTLTNYEFVRSKDHVKPICMVAKRQTFLICDESIFLQSYKALQTKGTRTIRKKCGRMVLLNGTPGQPTGLYSQGRMMSDSILDCDTKVEFRSRYAVETTRNGFPQIVQWKNLEDLSARFAPYVLRRLKEQCLDLPEKMPPVALHVPLKDPTWEIYTEMRDQMVVWLKSPDALSAAYQSVVKAMRLAQITSGFIGGILGSDELIEEMQDDVMPDWLIPFESAAKIIEPLREIGSEKQDYFLEWLGLRLDEDPNFKLLVRVRFRFELTRLAKAIHTTFPGVDVGELHGGSDKITAVRLLNPKSANPNRPAVVLSTSAGAFGHNMAAAHTVMRISRDYSYFLERQFDDRVHRRGQTHPVSYFDLIAQGPRGQKTIDHMIVKAVRAKEEIENWVTSKWIQELSS